MSIPTVVGEISHENALPGVSGGGAAHMCLSEEARVSQRLPRCLPGYLLVQGMRLNRLGSLVLES